MAISSSLVDRCGGLIRPKGRLVISSSFFLSCRLPCPAASGCVPHRFPSSTCVVMRRCAYGRAPALSGISHCSSVARFACSPSSLG